MKGNIGSERDERGVTTLRIDNPAHANSGQRTTRSLMLSVDRQSHPTRDHDPRTR